MWEESQENHVGSTVAEVSDKGSNGKREAGSMNEITISKFKILRAQDIKKAMPIRLMSDGVQVGIIIDGITPVEKVKTKCPNCKMEYLATVPDGKPGFFTVRHPKE